MTAWIRRTLKYWLLCRRYPESRIYYGASIDSFSSLGRNVVIFPKVELYNSIIDDYSYIQENSILSSVKVGKFCSIASNVYIGLVDHPTDMVSTTPVFYDNKQPLPKFFIKEPKISQKLPITYIEPDVWIGLGVIIKAGVRIGVGAVIGAGAIVTKDIPAYSIAVGSPCKPIKKRFSDKVCERLLQSEWWTLSDDELENLAPTFVDPELFLATIEKK